LSSIKIACFFMKKVLTLSFLALFGWLISCGPAAEDRQRMHERAKVFQDSIANFIRQSMTEAEMPAAAQQPVVVDTAAARRAQQQQSISPNPNVK
jgi:hypothetical protein